MKQYKGLLLDLDHCLYDYDKAHKSAMEVLFEWAEVLTGRAKPEIEEAFSMSRKAVHSNLKNTAASHNRLLYFQGLFERLGLNPLDAALEAYEVYWGAFFEKMELREGTLEFLEKFEGEICLLTDLTAQIQYQKIDHLQLAPYLAHLVTSEEVGAEKPSPKMFETGLAKLGLLASEVCMIGDNYAKDCLGAASVNIHSYWLQTGPEAQPENPLVTHFTTFNQLTELL
ncbi:MAG: HAD family hydrolase [SAR324 cluster bacterium]|nr:HAD family hydrolase [SAR324 cluster bacterium]